ncbi:MAG: response regulator transcription factor [Limnochordales bacterium]|nr:response regulator transcription factor [Limnochordales bacterium]
MVKVLVVDDEPSIVELVRFALAREGFASVAASDGQDALDKVEAEHPDLVLLDLMLPKVGGLDVCRILRQKHPSLPIIILTARGDETDKVLGLELGADDYITKPFSPRELVARVRAVLRRTAPGGEEAGTLLRVGPVTLDPQRYEVTVRGRKVELAPKEFDLLRMLMANKGVVLSRDVLLQKVWGYDFAGDTRTIDVHIVRLRQKIEDDPSEPRLIETVRGVGYRFRDVEGQ